MKTIEELLNSLKKNELNAITKVMAFMSYNPSIGRALNKGGVKIFQSMVIRKIKSLHTIHTAEEFDRFHKKWVNQFIKRIKSNQNQNCSIGQAQKAINVFLKVYIDWARLPDRITADRLVPYIHVPLDSILMKSIMNKFPKFKKEILSKRQVNNYSNSLSKIDQSEYDCWQKFFREAHSAKPILFDIIWALERKAGGGT